MKPLKIIPVLFLTIVLGITARAQEPVVIQKSVTNGNTISTATYSVGSGAGGDYQRIFEDVQQKARAAMEDAAAGVGAVNNNINSMASGRAFAVAGSGRKPMAPGLLVWTRTLDATTRAEWQEDLRVMDKLLREQLAVAEGGPTPHAMGIRLWMTDNSFREPMLLEDYGVVFFCEVGFPLADSPTGRPAQKRDGQPTSAWERARREVQGASRPGAGNSFRHPVPATSPDYDAARVEALVDALAGVLPEARNIRHLDAKAVILVSVTGTDNAGAPVRLTLKATRSELEKAAGGDAAAAEFRKTLAWSVQ